MSSAALVLSAVRRPAVNHWVVALVVVVPTFMEILDTTVANVALRYIAGGLSAAQSDADWVITSYLAANAIVLPITGWLSARLGRRNYFLLSIFFFTLASAACGFATSLGQMIFFRVVQGLAGGGLQPCSQGVLMDSFPQEKQGTAMTLFAVAAIIAPIVGPTLGGWLCVDYNWRWIFLVNVPIGLFSLVAAYLVVQDPDYLQKERAELRKKPLNFDYLGLGLLALLMSCWEVMLSKGQEWDWLGDPCWRVQTLVVIQVVCLGLLIFREMQIDSPIIDFRVLGERNFTIACAVLFCAFAVVYASSIALPGMLQTLFGYDALRAGLVMSPSGASSLAAMVLVGYLMGRQWDARWLVAARVGRPCGGRQLLDGADEPPDQPLAGGRAADGADPRPGTAVRADERGRLQVRPGASARGGGRAAQPPPYRGRQRGHLDGHDHPGAARAVPPRPPDRLPWPPELPRPRLPAKRPRVLPAENRGRGPVASEGGAIAGRPAPAAGRVDGLLRCLLAVRRPVGDPRRSGPADEALGGRAGRAHRRGVASATRWGY